MMLFLGVILYFSMYLCVCTYKSPLSLLASLCMCIWGHHCPCLPLGMYLWCHVLLDLCLSMYIYMRSTSDVISKVLFIFDVSGGMGSLNNLPNELGWWAAVLQGLVLQVCTTMNCWFCLFVIIVVCFKYMFWVLNSSPHACKAHILHTKLWCYPIFCRYVLINLRYWSSRKCNYGSDIEEL